MGKLTFWLRSGLAGDWNRQGVDVENAEDEGGESGFGEHDRKRREGKQIATAPGLKFGRLEGRTGVSCAAAEETGRYTSTIL